MKFLFDFFPVAAFFIAYYIPDDLAQRMFVATAVAIIAVIIQVSVYWLIYRRVEKMHLVTLVVILILGGITLITHDKRFFMWKPTVVNWVFAMALMASEFIGKKNLMQRLMEHAIEMPAHVWVKLNRGWMLFFVFMGGINLYVAFNFVEHVWVNFKLFGILGLTLLFAIAQTVYLSRYLVEQNKE